MNSRIYKPLPSSSRNLSSPSSNNIKSSPTTNLPSSSSISVSTSTIVPTTATVSTAESLAKALASSLERPTPVPLETNRRQSITLATAV